MAMHAESEITVNPEEEESDEEGAATVEVMAPGEVAPPRRRRRLKLFVVFHGDRASRRLPHSVRVKCPRDGSWESGPEGPRLLRQTFIKRYAEVQPRAPGLDAVPTYLADQFGTPLADNDILKLYVESEGVLHLMIGDHGLKKGAANAVVQWGYNAVDSSAPLAPAPMRSLARARVVGMDCGWLHAAVVLESGRVMAWGSNEFGQLGTGDEVKSSEPVLCKLDADVVCAKTVCCGAYFTLVVDVKGDLWTWGRYQASNWPTKFTETWTNGYVKKGELGIKGEEVTLVAAGEAHAAVATASGALFTWGYNEQGQLGWGTDKSDREGQQKPRKVVLHKNLQQEPQISAVNPVVALACGGQHTAVALRSGQMWAWGSNFEGQMAHVLRQAHGEPQLVNSMEHETCAAVACGRYSTLAITATGCAYFWGSLSGSSTPQTQLGKADMDALKEGKEIPQRDAGEAPEFGQDAKSSSSSGASRMLAGAAKQLLRSDVAAAAVGEAHGILQAKGGHLYGWGYNAYGQALAKVDRATDIIDDCRAVDLADHHKPPATQVLKMCASGGTTTVLVKQA